MNTLLVSDDLRPGLADAVVQEITAAGGKAFAVVQNIASREGIRAAVMQTNELGGRFDILVNNAAWVRYQAIADIQLETMDRMLDVGFKAVIWGMQAASRSDGPRAWRSHRQRGIDRCSALHNQLCGVFRHQVRHSWIDPRRCCRTGGSQNPRQCGLPIGRAYRRHSATAMLSVMPHA